MDKVILGPGFRFYDCTRNKKTEECTVYIQPFCLKHSYPKEKRLKVKWLCKLGKDTLNCILDFVYKNNTILCYPKPIKTVNRNVISPKRKHLYMSIYDDNETILFERDVHLFSRFTSSRTVRNRLNVGISTDLKEFDIIDDREENEKDCGNDDNEKDDLNNDEEDECSDEEYSDSECSDDEPLEKKKKEKCDNLTSQEEHRLPEKVLSDGKTCPVCKTREYIKIDEYIYNKCSICLDEETTKIENTERSKNIIKEQMKSHKRRREINMKYKLEQK